MLKTFVNAWKVADLRKKMIFTAIIVFIFTFIILSNFKGGAVSYGFGYGGIFLPLGGLLLGGGTAGMYFNGKLVSDKGLGPTRKLHDIYYIPKV